MPLSSSFISAECLLKSSGLILMNNRPTLDSRAISVDEG